MEISKNSDNQRIINNKKIIPCELFPLKNGPDKMEKYFTFLPFF